MRLLLSLFLIICISTKALGDVRTLQELEEHIDNAPTIDISKTEIKASSAQVKILKSQLHPSLFSSITYSSYTNPVQSETYTVQNYGNNVNSTYNETLIPHQQRYQNITYNIGLSMPLFGSYESVKKSLVLQESDEKASKYKLETSRLEALKALRYAYSAYYFANLQKQVAMQFLQDENQTKEILSKRVKNGLLFKSDMLEIESEFLVAKRNESVANMYILDSLHVLQTLTNLSLDNFDAIFPQVCTKPDALNISQLEKENSQILLYQTKLEGYKKAALHNNSLFSTGQLSLSFGLQNNFQGSYGTNVMLSLNVSMPIFEKEYRKGVDEAMVANLEKAKLELKEQKLAYQNAMSKFLALYESRLENIDFAKKRLDAALENLRIAISRKNVDPDSFNKIIKAKYNLYQVINDYIQAQWDFANAQIDLLGLGVERKRCEAIETNFSNNLNKALIELKRVPI